MTDSAPLQVFLNVSANLRAARQRLGVSQDKLATAAGVSRRMLVNIEAGESNVSLATLDKLAVALGLSFADMVRAPEAPPAPVRVWQGASPGSHAHLMESLTASGSTVELWEWRLAPGEVYEAGADPAGSHEMLYVIAGELTLELPGRAVTLAAGQTHTFASDVDYRYRNAGAAPLVFTKNVVVSAPRPLA